MASGNDGMGVLRRAAERTPRRAALRAVVFLVIAAGSATLAGVILTRYVAARTASARLATVPVVVAALDLPEATTLRRETLAVVDWPATTVPEGAASDPAALEGRVARARIVKGEPVLAVRLAATDAGHGLAAILPPGSRAVAVRVDDVVGVAGFIHPGDKVDVIVTMRPTDSGSGSFVSKIILQNIAVLAVGKQLDRKDRSADSTVSATVATLMVDSEESERLALAATKGQILLSLRGGVDTELVETPGVSPPTLVRFRVEPPVVAERPATLVRRVVVRPPPAAPKGPVVEILRGDLYERRDFDKGGTR